MWVVEGGRDVQRCILTVEGLILSKTAYGGFERSAKGVAETVASGT
jgi:hypothetical protein